MPSFADFHSVYSKRFSNFWRSALGVVLILFVLSMQASAQSTRNCFAIWNGFSQHWGVQNRLARIGDWIMASGNRGECKAEAGHAAAASKGADRADFVQYHAWVETGLVEFQEGIGTMIFDGREGESITMLEEGEVEFPNAEEGAVSEVLLNGFDLCTAEGAAADNLQSFELAIDSVWTTDVPGKIRFRMRASIRFSCTTPGCEPLNQVVNYHLQIHWLALQGTGFRSLRSSYGGGRDWEKKDTTARPPMGKVALLGAVHFPQATAGITGLHLQLDRSQPMLAWESRIQPMSYSNGLLTLGMRMDFVQNDSAMFAANKAANGGPRSPQRKASKGKAGSLVWEMNVALLQFEDAEITSGSRSGSIQWQGSRKTTASTKETEITAEILR